MHVTISLAIYSQTRAASIACWSLAFQLPEVVPGSPDGKQAVASFKPSSYVHLAFHSSS